MIETGERPLNMIFNPDDAILGKVTSSSWIGGGYPDLLFGKRYSSLEQTHILKTHKDNSTNSKLYRILASIAVTNYENPLLHIPFWFMLREDMSSIFCYDSRFSVMFESGNKELTEGNIRDLPYMLLVEQGILSEIKKRNPNLQVLLESKKYKSQCYPFVPDTNGCYVKNDRERKEMCIIGISPYKGSDVWHVITDKGWKSLDSVFGSSFTVLIFTCNECVFFKQGLPLHLELFPCMENMRVELTPVLTDKDIPINLKSRTLEVISEELIGEKMPNDPFEFSKQLASLNDSDKEILLGPPTRDKVDLSRTFSGPLEEMGGSRGTQIIKEGTFLKKGEQGIKKYKKRYYKLKKVEEGEILEYYKGTKCQGRFNLWEYVIDSEMIGGEITITLTPRDGVGNVRYIKGESVEETSELYGILSSAGISEGTPPLGGATGEEEPVEEEPVEESQQPQPSLEELQARLDALEKPQVQSEEEIVIPPNISEILKKYGITITTTTNKNELKKQIGDNLDKMEDKGLFSEKKNIMRFMEGL